MMSNSDDAIYVVVADNNVDQQYFPGFELIDPNGPIVMEQYTRTATIENARALARTITPKYGKCRIAKLQFLVLDDEESKT